MKKKMSLPSIFIAFGCIIIASSVNGGRIRAKREDEPPSDSQNAEALENLKKLGPCPWIWGGTSKDNLLQCMDGSTCTVDDTDHVNDSWKCCNEHDGRAVCPKNYPYMCASQKCGGGAAHCCEENCSEFGGDREASMPEGACDMPEPDNSDEFDNASESDDMGGSDDEADPNAGSGFFVPQNPDDYAVPNAWDGINGASEADDFDGIDSASEPDDMAGSGGWVLDDASEAGADDFSGDGIQDPDWVYVD